MAMGALWEEKPARWYGSRGRCLKRRRHLHQGFRVGFVLEQLTHRCGTHGCCSRTSRRHVIAAPFDGFAGRMQKPATVLQCSLGGQFKLWVMQNAPAVRMSAIRLVSMHRRSWSSLPAEARASLRCRCGCRCFGKASRRSWVCGHGRGTPLNWMRSPRPPRRLRIPTNPIERHLHGADTARIDCLECRTQACRLVSER